MGTGTYTATITLQDTADASDKVSVTVSLTVNAPAAFLSVNPASFSFTAVAGGNNPTSQTINVNANNGSISWTAATTYTGGSTGGWLNFTPISGTTTQAGTTPITFNVNIDRLVAGVYTATITFQDSANTSDKAVVTITLKITPSTSPPIMSANPTSIAYGYEWNRPGGGIVPVTLSVTNSPVAWQAELICNDPDPQQCGWVTIDTDVGIVTPNKPATIQVQADEQGGGADVYLVITDKNNSSNRVSIKISSYWAN